MTELYDENIFDKINIDKYNIIIKNIVSQAIKLQFTKLNKKELEIFIEYITKITLLIIQKLNITNPEKQFVLNNFRDIYSFIVLAMPYYLIDNSKEISSFNEILINENGKSKIFESTYYIDHKFDDLNALNIYIDEMYKIIEMGLENMKHKLLANYMNIYNYRMDNYEKSYIYKDFIERYKNKRFERDNLELGNYTLYGVINNFLFGDIIKIKWFIYDKEKIIKNKKYYFPNIIILANEYKINNILDINKDEIREEDINNIINYMRRVEEENILEEIINSFIYFLKYTKSLNRILRIKDINNKLKREQIRIIKKYIDEIDDETDSKIIDEDVIITRENRQMIREVLRIIIKNIERGVVEEYYRYIYSSMMRYKYTWYGYRSIDNKNKIYGYEEYIERNKDINIELDDDYKPESELLENYRNKYLIYSLKIYYNYFKSILHVQEGDEYKRYNKTHSYNGMSEEIQDIFIGRLNTDRDNINNFYNIRGNIERNYLREERNNYNRILIGIEINKKIKDRILKDGIIVKIIFETLVYNGILTYFKYNPKSTDKSILPNKNKQKDEYKRVLTKNLIEDMSKNDKAYNFINNIEYKEHNILYKEEKHKNKTYKDYIIGKNSWFFELYCVEWTRQIKQIINHNNGRVIYITGGTGAGKSLGSPIIGLYNQKIMNFNNNAKVITTVPRINPVKNNAYRMAQQLGVPIQKSRINYVQYKTAKDYAYDNEYHMKLLIITDGSFFNDIVNNFILRSEKNNICDLLLVDEHHEHNTYMDMIMTLFRTSAYYNNRITIGMISATMDTEEPQYRKYYRVIDDDWKYPIIEDRNKGINKNIMDRRVHLSEPFGNLNYTVNEIDFIGKSEIYTVLEIIKKSTQGDILVFEPGQKEIDILVEEINKRTPSDVLAIPFYSKLDEKILEYIGNIHVPEIRKKFRYPKNGEYTIENIDEEIPDKVEENTYKRFVIVGTNIAEASITIDTLSYVVETGTSKINKYYVESNQSILEKVSIAISNQKQRKGRVGRVQPGTVYYLYDRKKLNEKSIPNIYIENIAEKIILLLNTENEVIKFDPYNNNIEEIKAIEDEKEIIDEIIEGYQVRRIKDGKLEDVYCDREIRYKEYRDKMPRCDKNGRYKINELYDYNGRLYLNHPDEMDLKRDEELNIINIRERNKKYEKMDLSKNIVIEEYKNKVLLTLEYLKKIKILDENYNKSELYERITSNIFAYMADLGLEISLEDIMVVVDVLKYYYGVERDNKLIKMLIIYLTFVNNRKNIKIDKKLEIKICEYLHIFFILENKYFRVNINEMKNKIINILDKIEGGSKIKMELTSINNDIRRRDEINEDIRIKMNKIIEEIEDEILKKDVRERYNRIRNIEELRKLINNIINSIQEERIKSKEMREIMNEIKFDNYIRNKIKSKIKISFKIYFQ